MVFATVPSGQPEHAGNLAGTAQEVPFRAKLETTAARGPGSAFHRRGQPRPRRWRLA